MKEENRFEKDEKQFIFSDRKENEVDFCIYFFRAAIWYQVAFEGGGATIETMLLAVVTATSSWWWWCWSDPGVDCISLYLILLKFDSFATFAHHEQVVTAANTKTIRVNFLWNERKNLFSAKWWKCSRIIIIIIKPIISTDYNYLQLITIIYCNARTKQFSISVFCSISVSSLRIFFIIRHCFESQQSRHWIIRGVHLLTPRKRR